MSAFKKATGIPKVQTLYSVETEMTGLKALWPNGGIITGNSNYNNNKASTTSRLGCSYDLPVNSISAE